MENEKHERVSEDLPAGPTGSVVPELNIIPATPAEEELVVHKFAAALEEEEEDKGEEEEEQANDSKIEPHNKHSENLQVPKEEASVWDPSLLRARSSDLKFPAPAVPVTQSQLLNKMLSRLCAWSTERNNGFYWLMAHFICMTFTLINWIYKKLTVGQEEPSRSRWMLACIISVVVLVVCTWCFHKFVLAVVVSIYMITTSLLALIDFLVIFLYHVTEILFRWSLSALGLSGCSIALAAAVFFDKNNNKTRKQR